MTIQQELLELVEPIIQFLQGQPIKPALEKELEEKFPKNSERLEKIQALLRKGLEEEFPMRGKLELRFGRLLKNSETQPFSLDLVDMNCKGPGHTHPLGEIDLCFPQDPTATFDGRSDTWIVYGENSWHEPTVENGRMYILYFLPQGSIRFGAKEA